MTKNTAERELPEDLANVVRPARGSWGHPDYDRDKAERARHRDEARRPPVDPYTNGTSNKRAIGGRTAKPPGSRPAWRTP